jgi:septum formation protein
VLVLASNSPRRREILKSAGLAFVVRAPNILEERRAHESAVDYVRRLAEEKARAVPLHSGEIVLAADTVVVLGDQVLEKPRDQLDAIRMLTLLSGREHQVVSGICLRTPARTLVDSASTRVRFVQLAPEEIADYAASGEPMDKAGGYAIQGLASKFVERIDGCYFNVMGLPIALVYAHLKTLGWDGSL